MLDLLSVDQVPFDHIADPDLARQHLAVSKLEELLEAVASLEPEVCTGMDVGTVDDSNT